MIGRTLLISLTAFSVCASTYADTEQRPESTASLLAQSSHAIHTQHPSPQSTGATFGSSAQGAPGISDTEIIIGSCLPLTGKLQMRGQLIFEAANSYFNHVNDQGGINGRKIKFVACDDAFDPQQAIKCFNSCLKDKVFVASFFIGSPEIVKYVRMSEINHVALLGILNGTTAAYDFRPEIFILRPSYKDEVDKQVAQLWDILHIRKIALLFESDAFGSSVREALTSAIHSRGGTGITEVSYARGGSDLTEALNRARADKPEALILAANSAVVKEIAKLRESQKWNQICLAFSSVGDALTQAGQAADGMMITQVAPSLEGHLPCAAQYQKLIAKYYPHSRAHPGGLEAFLNAVVLVEGLKRCGREINRAKFQTAMESLHNFDVGAGPGFEVNFSAKNHIGWPAKAIYFEMIRGGRLSPVSATEWAEMVKRAQSPQRE